MIQKFWKPYDFSWLYLKRAAELKPRYYFNTFKADLHKQRSKKKFLLFCSECLFALYTHSLFCPEKGVDWSCADWIGCKLPVETDTDEVFHHFQAISSANKLFFYFQVFLNFLGFWNFQVYLAASWKLENLQKALASKVLSTNTLFKLCVHCVNVCIFAMDEWWSRWS